MLGISEAIGYVIGLAGLSLAVYSIVKQKKLEKRLKEKDRLKNLSEQIHRKLSRDINDILNGIKSPMNDEDDFMDLKMLGQEIISSAFECKSNKIAVNVWIDIFLKSSDSSNLKESNYIHLSEKNKGLILENFNDGKCKYASIKCSTPTSEEENYQLGTGDTFFRRISYLHDDLYELDDEFGDIIREFKPDLFPSMKECSKNMFEAIAISVIKSKSIEINVSDFDTALDIGLWVRNTASGCDDLVNYIEQLRSYEIILDEFREKLMHTSYT